MPCNEQRFDVGFAQCSQKSEHDRFITAALSHHIHYQNSILNSSENAQTNSTHKIFYVRLTSHQRQNKRDSLKGGRMERYLWMPEHSIQSVMPRLMLAQRGSDCPQSQQNSFPGMACTRCRALSTLTGFTDSQPESRLPRDADECLSRLYNTTRIQNKHYN